MPRIRVHIETELPLERILNVITDFSTRRPDFWPAIDRRKYQVHAVGDTWADVTEGTDFLGGIWARERYDWSSSDTVRATAQDSNVCKPGGIWEFRLSPRAAGGCDLDVLYDRRAKGLKGLAFMSLMTIVGHSVVDRSIRRTLTLIGES